MSRLLAISTGVVWALLRLVTLLATAAALMYRVELKATLAQSEAGLKARAAADDSVLQMKIADLRRIQAAVDLQKDILATQQAQVSQGTASQIWLNSVPYTYIQVAHRLLPVVVLL